MEHRATSVSIKILDSKSSNRMTKPYVYERLVKKASEKLLITEAEVVRRYRIYYIDNFKVEQEIDNDEEFQLALEEIRQLLDIYIERRENDQESSAPSLSSQSARSGPIGKDPHGIMARLGRIVKNQGLSLRQAFDVFDTNKDGKIEKKELLNVIQTVEVNYSFVQLEELWDGIPKDQYGYLNYREFCVSLESNSMPSSNTETQHDSIMKVRQRITQILRSKNIFVHAVFVTFDKNHSGRLS